MEAKKQEKPQKLIHVFGSKYKEEVISVLLDKPDNFFTINNIVDNVSASYNSVKNFLRQLERFGVVEFRKKGTGYLVKYNPDSKYHSVLKELLKVENQVLRDEAERFADRIYEDDEISQKIHSIILFGSAARGTAGPESDIDLLILTEKTSEVEKLKNSVRNRWDRSEIQNVIVPVVETVEEFKENLEKGERFEKNVSRDGIVLKGEISSVKN